MVPFRLQLREPPLERSNLLLRPPKILVIEQADLLAVRFLAFDLVVGSIVRYINHLVCQPLNLKSFCKRVLLPEVGTLSQPKEHSRARWHACVLADLPQRYAIRRYAFTDQVGNFWTVRVPRAPR
jgi:hypothetical protein